MNTQTSRIHVVDALRGFAIVSIMLLHNIEHFDYYYTVKNLPEWMQIVDKGIWDTLFFLFGGKSYAIFALLFGLTFFIQDKNQEKRGIDFRLRFAWRLVLLFGFGLINSLFYEGDILMIYAMIGFFIIPFARLQTKWVLIFAIIFMLQPFEWIKVITLLINPAYEFSKPVSGMYFSKMSTYIEGDSLLNTFVGNITNGRLAVLNWTWENGRVFQTLALFLFGILAGRTAIFVKNDANMILWKRILLCASLLFIPLFWIKLNMGDWITDVALRRSLKVIETSLTNMAFMLILVSGFVILFQTKTFSSVLNVFSPLGRMSLSNYIIQSVAGSFIYYGFGLGLYQYTGATYCLIIGLALAFLQGLFSAWWLKNHQQGPLEHLWHKATWIKIKGSRSE
jgi:uncharacterized protein